MRPVSKTLIPCVSLLLSLAAFIAPVRNPDGSFSDAREPQETIVFDDLPSPCPLEIRALSSMLCLPACTAGPCKSEEAAEKARAEFARAAALLPEGVLDSVQALLGRVPVLLCGSITSASDQLPEAPRACLCDCGGTLLLLFDAEAGEVFPAAAHELCHLVDRALEAASRFDSSHWSETGWLALCPEGFRYLGAYLDGSGAPAADSLSPAYTAERSGGGAYFISRYSKTFPTEDRATLLEALARLGPDSRLMRSPHIIRKLRYYTEAVRYYLAGGV